MCFRRSLPLPDERYKKAAQVTGFFRAAAGAVEGHPRCGGSHGVDAPCRRTEESKAGWKLRKDAPGRMARADPAVSEGYFRVLSIAFKMGRGFTDTEMNDARKVAVVNETFVRKYFSRGRADGAPRAAWPMLESLGRSGDGALV